MCRDRWCWPLKLPPPERPATYCQVPFSTPVAGSNRLVYRAPPMPVAIISEPVASSRPPTVNAPLVADMPWPVITPCAPTVTWNVF